MTPAIRTQSRVTCDAEGCAAVFSSLFDIKLQPSLFKGDLRTNGWWCVDVLGSTFPGPKQLCPRHQDQRPNASR